MNEIRYGMFENCTSLSSIYSPNPVPPTISSGTTFENVPRTATVYVPEGSVEAYKAAPYWKEFFIEPMKTDPSVGVESAVSEDTEGSVTVFNVNGTKIYEGERSGWNSPQAGIYVICRNGKKEKVLIH